MMTTPFIDWCTNARQSSVKIWGYEGLIDDDPESAKQAWRDGEDAEKYILELGESLDLHKATKYWLGGYGI